MTNALLYDTLPHPTGPISSTLISVDASSVVAIVLLVALPILVLTLAVRWSGRPRRRVTAVRPILTARLEARGS